MALHRQSCLNLLQSCFVAHDFKAHDFRDTKVAVGGQIARDAVVFARCVLDGGGVFFRAVQQPRVEQIHDFQAARHKCPVLLNARKTGHWEVFQTDFVVRLELQAAVEKHPN